MIISIILGFSLQQCTTGCLKCQASTISTNPTGICQLCDISSNYVISGTGCVGTTLTNCSLVSATGSCLVCNSNYYVNSSSGNCIAVPSTSQISNCSTYGSTGSCSSCASGYYILNNVCTQITSTISNCTFYSTALTCSGCASGYIVSTDLKSCQTSNLGNCIRYSNSNCFGCNSGYTLNENQGQYNFLQSGGILQSNVDYSNSSGNLGSYGLNSYSSKIVCQQNTVTGCKTYSSFSSCAACSTGYYLDSFGNCIIFPSPVILNCNLYSSLTACSSCNQGYFLASSTQCTAITTIANCISYSQTANTSQCTSCSSAYYLSSNVCNLRTNSSILNCLTYNPNFDYCLTCATSYTLTTDSKACLPVISNCLTYNSSSSTTTTLVCNTCTDLYYLSGTSCVLGTVTNCKTYVQGSINTCSICQNQYYISANQCILHSTITNCLTYSTVTPNTCTTCNATSAIFTINNICVASITNLVGCIKYATSSTCTTCGTGYYLSGSTCTAITVGNCVAYNGTNCTKCTTGYMLHTDNLCYLPHDFQKDNCSAISTDATYGYIGSKPWSALACSSCAAGTYEVDMASQPVCVKDDAIKLFITPVPSKSNCQVYDYNAPTKCKICKNGFYLIADESSCVIDTACPTSVPTISYIDPAKTTRKYGSCLVGGTNIPSAADCQLAGPSVNLDNTVSTGNVCIKCAAGNSMTFFDKAQGTMFNWSSGTTLTNSSEPTSPVVRYMSGICKAVAAGNLVTDCDIHAIFASTTKKCYKCKWGYYTTIIAGDVGSTCTKDNNCDQSPPLDGIELQWTGRITCVKCLDGGIPLYATTDPNAKATADIGFWLTTEIICKIGDPNPTQPGPSYLCVPSGQRNFVTNCVAHYLAAAETCASNKDNVLCAVCLPGYKRDVATGKTCTKITNCDFTVTQIWYNNCSKCSTGFVHKSNADGGVDYTACGQSNTVTNCLASNAEATCIYCQKGYQLTSTSSCDKIDSPRCSSGATNFSQKVATTPAVPANAVTDYAGSMSDAHLQKSNIASTYFYLTPGVNGCSSCNTGYTAFVNLASSLPVCVKSTRGKPIPTITNCSNYIRTTTTVFADNTNSYGYTLKCTTCANGYIINETGTACTAQSVIPNCLIANSSNNTSCYTCNTGYSLVSAACQVQSVSNCSTYQVADASAPTCLGCADGYYLLNNQCNQGSITNCAQYLTNQANFCQTCLSGFTLLNTLNSGYYCISYDSTLNCASFDANTISNGQISCTSCTGINNYITPATAIKTGCWALNSISNCATYNIQSSIVNSSYLCSVCATGYYLNTSGVCVQRVYQPSNCSVYSPTSDTCTTCTNNSFISNNGQTCTNFPTGIPFCSNYTNATVCNQCSSPYYLNSNACSAVSPTIANCNLYQSNSVCIGCANGFAPINGACVQATALNCLTYSSSTACATCATGYGLQTVGGVVNCIAYTDLNCVTSGNTYPFVCTQCKVNYYPNTSGICTAVGSSIINCLVYDSTTTCTQCSAGTILALSRTACTSNSADTALLDTNCNNAAYVNSPVCSACSIGFYFSSGACIACPSISGCKSCNPLNTAQCQICASGYYQSPDLTCKSVTGYVNGTTANLTAWTYNTSSVYNPYNRNLNYTDFVGSSKIMSLFLMIFTVLML